MQNISDIIKNKDIKGDTRNKYEFQAYGNRLADELNDDKHRSLYIKLAKEEDRNLLELAREFVVKQKHIGKKGPLFMWKLKQLKEKKKESDSKIEDIEDPN